MEANNMAELREALEYASRVLAKWRQDAPFSAWNEYGEAIDRCRASLAAPARNCDVGTPKEQLDRFDTFCHDQKSCEPCPCNQILPSGEERCNCFEWSQMPYEEERKGAADESK